MVGRKPIPTATKVLRGNPGHRPLNDQEAKPKTKAKLPKAPSYLNDVAKKEWRRMGRRLFDAGLLTELDETALASYCQSYSSWVEANEKVQELGAVVVRMRGPVRSPWVGIASQAWKEMTRMLGEFGMTPSSRSRVKVQTKPTGEEEEDWFSVHRN